MGKKRSANPRFSRWLNTQFTGESGSSSSMLPDEEPATKSPRHTEPSNPPNPPTTSTEDYGLPPPSPPPDPSLAIDLEEDIAGDEEYARLLHVALNKGPRGIPVDANIIPIEDSDDEPPSEEAIPDDLLAGQSAAGRLATINLPSGSSVLHPSRGGNPVLDSNAESALASTRTSLITSAMVVSVRSSPEAAEEASPEDAEERQE